jgi:mRNA interferase MazF
LIERRRSVAVLHHRGEIWLVDLGMAAKVRPALVLSIEAGPQDRELVTLVPHTTSVRGSRFEVPITKRFLNTGAFDAQNLVTIPRAKLVRRLGTLTADECSRVEASVKQWLALI